MSGIGAETQNKLLSEAASSELTHRSRTSAVNGPRGGEEEVEAVEVVGWVSSCEYVS